MNGGVGYQILSTSNKGIWLILLALKPYKSVKGCLVVISLTEQHELCMYKTKLNFLIKIDFSILS